MVSSKNPSTPDKDSKLPDKNSKWKYYAIIGLTGVIIVVWVGRTVYLIKGQGIGFLLK